jgi:hypothetical protein
MPNERFISFVTSKSCCLFRTQQFSGDLLDHLRRHDLLIDRYGSALDLDVDRCACADEDVRGAPVGHHLKELVENHPLAAGSGIDGGAISRRAAGH